MLKEKLSVYTVFLFFFLIGLITYGDYGIISKKNFKEFLVFIGLTIFFLSQILSN